MEMNLVTTKAENVEETGSVAVESVEVEASRQLGQTSAQQ